MLIICHYAESISMERLKAFFGLPSPPAFGVLAWIPVWDCVCDEHGDMTQACKEPMSAGQG